MGVLLYGDLMKLVCGVGVNDYCEPVKVNVDGSFKKIQAYAAWSNMLSRCYNEKVQIRQPTYKGVCVCDEWLSFSCFKIWFDISHVDGWQLDKDINGDGRMYSPNSCVYIPQWLNTFTNDCGSSRGDWPVGVYFHAASKKLLSRCSHPISGDRVSIGYFTCPDEAHKAWRHHKLEIAAELKDKMDEIDLRIYQRVVEIIVNAK